MQDCGTLVNSAQMGWPLSTQYKIPWHFHDFSWHSNHDTLTLSNPKPCFHVLHMPYSHYRKCSLYNHIQNDAISRFIRTSYWLNYHDYTENLSALIPSQSISATQLTLVSGEYMFCSFKTTVSPDKIFSLTFCLQFPDNCKIPWHFQVSQKNGHPAQICHFKFLNEY